MAAAFAVASNVAATFPSFSGTASRSSSSSSVSSGRAKVSCNAAATISMKARPGFRQFEGLRGEGSLASVQAFGGVPSKAEPSRRSSVRVAAAAVASPPAVAAPSKQKIRIKLRSYWVHLIQQACQQILDAAKSTNAETMGPVPLPTHKRIYCVLRSPHVDKDSREHFEIRTHRRLIDVANPNAQTIDALMQLDLPAGVDVEVKL